ncbi:MAG: toll/interleukin-1 receptor domain-containing protein [Bacteroidota bacterium]
MQYDAFISYSHRADDKLAPAIQRALHQIAKPWYKRRALNVFLDGTNLSVSPNLWGTIEEALGKARFFILLASPTASESKWVQKEIDYWLTHKSTDTMLIALTMGEIRWDDVAGDFDWTLTTALPTNLQGKFKAEPLHANFIAAKTENDLSLSNPAFKKDMIALAAAIHGKSINDLVSEEVKAHRRTTRVRNAVIFTLSLLVIIAAITTFWALDRTNYAEAQAQIANQQKREATDALLAIYLQRANIYKDSRNYLLALEELQKARALDSLDISVKERITELKTLIEAQ